MSTQEVNIAPINATHDRQLRDDPKCYGLKNGTYNCMPGFTAPNPNPQLTQAPHWTDSWTDPVTRIDPIYSPTGRRCPEGQILKAIPGRGGLPRGWKCVSPTRQDQLIAQMNSARRVIQATSAAHATSLRQAGCRRLPAIPGDRSPYGQFICDGGLDAEGGGYVGGQQPGFIRRHPILTGLAVGGLLYLLLGKSGSRKKNPFA